jgi:hypothetical protein
MLSYFVATVLKDNNQGLKSTPTSEQVVLMGLLKPTDFQKQAALKMQGEHFVQKEPAQCRD